MLEASSGLWQVQVWHLHTSACRTAPGCKLLCAVLDCVPRSRLTRCWPWRERQAAAASAPSSALQSALSQCKHWRKAVLSTQHGSPRVSCKPTLAAAPALRGCREVSLRRTHRTSTCSPTCLAAATTSWTTIPSCSWCLVTACTCIWQAAVAVSHHLRFVRVSYDQNSHRCTHNTDGTGGTAG